MLRVADINQPVVATPSIRVDDCLRCNATANNRLQGGFRAVRHDLRVDFTLTLQEPEDRSLTRCPAPVLAPDTTSAEVAFVNFNLPGKGRDALALFGDALTNLEKDHGDGFTPAAGELGYIRRAEVQRKVARQLTKFLFGNSGTRVIAVSSSHLSSLALP